MKEYNELQERELSYQQWLSKFEVGSGHVKPTNYYYFPDWGIHTKQKSVLQKVFDFFISKFKF